MPCSYSLLLLFLLHPLKIIFLSFSQLTLFPLPYNLIFFVPLLIAACLAEILQLLLFLFILFLFIIFISNIIGYSPPVLFHFALLLPLLIWVWNLFVHFLAWIIFLTLIICSPSIPSKSFFFLVDISYSLFSFLSYSYYLSIFDNLCSSIIIVGLLCFFFNFVLIGLLFFSNLILCSFTFLFHFAIFLPLSTYVLNFIFPLFLFFTIIISLPSSLSKSLYFPLASHSLFSYLIIFSIHFQLY